MEERQREAIRIPLAISSEEAVFGTMRTLTLPGGHTMKVRLPAGIRDGQEVRLSKEGEWLPENSPGAFLVLDLSVVPDRGAGGVSSTDRDTGMPTEVPLVAPPPPEFAPGYRPSDPYNPYFSEGEGGYAPAFAAGFASSTPRQRGRRRRYASLRTILLAALVLLLVVGVSILAYYYAAPRSSQPHRTSTATTRSVNPLTATATTLHAIYVQATTGTPAIADPLSQQNSDNWDEDPNCAFTGGTYHATAMQSDTFFACNAVATHFDNFAYQVQITIIKGDYGGIIFRSDSAAANTYIFTIDHSGSYSFTVYQNDNELQVLSNGVSTAFRNGLNEANIITVVAQGSSFYLYVNGQFVTSANDSTYRSGEIGVLAGENAHPTEVAFQNVKVWRL